MPRLYLSATEFQSEPMAIALAPLIAQLPAGTLDRLLDRASRRCDSFCDRRLQAPGTSTLSQPTNANTTTISVSSTLTLDDLAEQAVIIDAGNSNQETVDIVPGGVNVTTWAMPYPGILTLAQPLMFGHSSGAPVQYVYKEVSEATRASQSDPYSEALQSQAAQLALAHLPPVHVGLTRITFLKSYPIQTVLTVEHSYSFDTTYNLIYNNSDPTYNGQIIIEPTSGYLRYRVGTVIIPEGMTRTTYIGGYQTIPADIKQAVTYYMADALALFVNPYGVAEQQMGKQRMVFNRSSGSAGSIGKSLNTQYAEAILDKRYRRRT